MKSPYRQKSELSGMSQDDDSLGSQHDLTNSRIRYMMTIYRFASIGLLLLLLAAIGVVGGIGGIQPSIGQDIAPPGKAIPSVEAINRQELRGRVGQTIVVIGDVSRVGKSAGGNRFINFDGNPELTIFISSEDVEKFGPETPERLYSDKTIAVTGLLERFKGQLQIRARQPGAIGVVAKPSFPPPTGPRPDLPPPFALKQVGRDVWVSPEGLRYAGRDPDGLTRKDHVLRHSMDIPDRDGPHGVFDGGPDHTFAWIDLAWQAVKAQKMKPETVGERDTYTVSIGRRIGYLGGRTGAEKNHPPLKRIFIVVRSGTSDVITAFPK